MKNKAEHKQIAEFIWKVCDLLRGNYKRNEYRKVILPLVVLTRFDVILLKTKNEVMRKYDSLKGKPETVIKATLNSITGLEFYNISPLDLKRVLDDPNQVAINFISYINGFSPNVREIIDRFRFDEQISRMDEKDILYKVIQKFVSFQTELSDLENEDMGYVFEEIIRIGSEQANEEAGEHFTPREVIKLMVYILLSPQNRMNLDNKIKKFYDPACGTGGMLSMGEQYIKEFCSTAQPHLFGQDMNDEAWAICRSDMLIKGNTRSEIVLGDTFRKDGFKGQKFDYMLANPPFGVSWENQRSVIENEWETMGFDGRFGAGTPRINDGSFLFLQHMISKMYSTNPDDPHGNGGDGSRIAIIFNGSPLFNGDAGGGESEIRRWIIENDYLEAVIALPDSLFYNTGISTYLWVLTNNKEERRKGKIQLIDARKFWNKMFPKSLNFKRKCIPNGDGKGPGDYITAIMQIYDNFANNQEYIVTNPDDGAVRVTVSKIFPNEHFAYYKVAMDRPLHLNFCVNSERIELVKQEAGFKAIATSKKKSSSERLIEIEIGEKRQETIIEFLKAFAEKTGGRLYKDRKAFLTELRNFDKAKEIRLNASELKAILSGLSERDDTADICVLPNGDFEADPMLADTEQVPVTTVIEGYKALIDRKKAGLIDNIPLNDNEKAIVKSTIDEYINVEVLPHVPDARIDYNKTKIGYEIPMTKEFYIYQPPRDIDVINAEIKALEKEIAELLYGGEIV